MILVNDRFLKDFNGVRDYADTANYVDVVSPVDNVTYPGINAELPVVLKAEVLEKLAAIHGQSVVPNHMFMRLSPQGVRAPHQAHTDSTMGQYTLILYMNRLAHVSGGTSLVKHRATGMESDLNLTKSLHAHWERDTNNYNAWSITKMVAMQPNRAFVFPSHMMHRAEPLDGFGFHKKNARLVLTCFYNLGEDYENPIRKRI
jgi:hypothetical protein